MSDTWSDIQAIKTKQSTWREKLARRKKERQDAVDEIIRIPSSCVRLESLPVSSVISTSLTTPVSASVSQPVDPQAKDEPKCSEHVKLAPKFLSLVEATLVHHLMDITLNLPVELNALLQLTIKALDKDIPYSVIDDLLQKYAAQGLLSFCSISNAKDEDEKMYIESVDHSKLAALWDLEGNRELEYISRKRKCMRDSGNDIATCKLPPKHSKKNDVSKSDHAIESLLSQQSAKERENKKLSEEIQQLLRKSTAKEQSLAEKFRSQGGAQVKEFCTFGTKEECNRSNDTQICDKLHFNKIINKHTDESLGDCSFLNTCFHMDTCKYVHYEIDYSQDHSKVKLDTSSITKLNVTESSTTLFPAQWVQCDLRNFNMSVLGKFAVVMADPPWDIHMELPYGTMSDDEMRKLSVPILQDDGYIFLWVTGRAMELGRECLSLWGYERVDELIWVKTNQLQRIIRTGRTGHWLNHGKEHCLVGAKGNLKNINRGLDCDVIVAEVRATSHKPDEIYGIIERLSPGTRKIELFGRPHNIQPNWVTLGNQVDCVKLLDPEVVRAFKKVYPDGNCLNPS
jgi:mRNA (2'-O-methyladenosine-N6-)-methyltransferase